MELLANGLRKYRCFFPASLCFLILIQGCQIRTPEQSVAVSPERIVLTDYRQVPNYVGIWVTVEGEVSQRKIAGIIGVEIDANFDGEDMRGRLAQASGILETWTVTQKELDSAYAKHGAFANRGPGQFFRLVQPGNQKRLANAVPLDRSAE
ncbi:MAG: hypothetical protein AAGJ38_11305 [Planctomycetota bacterium]